MVAKATFGKLYIHHDYVTCRDSLPRFPFQRPFSENDVRFQHLKQNKCLPDPQKQRDRSWISITTWNLIDKCAFAV
jgi:hypothetical protein